MTTPERRRDARISMDRPAKVQCVMTGRYLPGVTCNVSSTGALLQLNSASLLVQGQRLRVGVAWNDHTAIIQNAQMTEAVVVRSFGINGRQQVALCFDERQELELALSA